MTDVLSAIEADGVSQPMVLIVEDMAGQRVSKSAALVKRGCVPLAVEDSDAAARELTASPGIDLVLTDIRLSQRDKQDRSGVELARFVKSAFPDLPVVGYSAFVSAEDLSPEDLGLFNQTYPKGVQTSKEIRVNMDECAQLAFESRRRRRDRGEARLASASDGTPGRMLEIVRSANLAQVEEVERVLHEAGFHLKLIKIPSTANSKPLIVWVRDQDGTVDVEVYGHSTLYVTGQSESEALEHLIDLIQLYWKELKAQEDLSGPALELHAFLAELGLGDG